MLHARCFGDSYQYRSKQIEWSLVSSKENACIRYCVKLWTWRCDALWSWFAGERACIWSRLAGYSWHCQPLQLMRQRL